MIREVSRGVAQVRPSLCAGGNVQMDSKSTGHRERVQRLRGARGLVCWRGSKEAREGRGCAGPPDLNPVPLCSPSRRTKARP